MALDVNAARARLSRAAGAFTPQQMLILGGLVAVAVIGLVALARWVSQPSYAVLSAGTTTEEVAKVTDALAGEGITYKLSANGSSVMVPTTELARAKLALSAAGLGSGTGGVEGYEILDKAGFTTSDFKQRVDYQRAKEGELTRSLLRMDGISQARVQLSIPEKRVFVDDQEPARASVLVGTSRPLDESAVRAIMATVAAAVPGLSVDNVTVADTSGRILSAAGLTGGGTDGLQLARRYEAALAAQAESMLSTIFGPGRAVVRVSADMDFDQVERKETVHDPQSAVPVAQQQTEERFQGSGAVPQGVVGVTGIQQDGTAETSNYEKNDTTTQVAVNRTETVQREAPGKIRRLSVAVALDGNLEPRPDAAQVRDLVAAAVGVSDDRGDTIVVEAAPFDGSMAAAAAEAAKAAASAESQNQMLAYVQTGGAVIVLLLAVLFLRRGLRGRRESVDEVDAAELARSASPFGVLPAAGADGDGASGSAVPVPAAVVLADDAASDASPAIERRNDPATEVLELIDREPDDVAALLRSWVADRRS